MIGLCRKVRQAENDAQRAKQQAAQRAQLQAQQQTPYHYSTIMAHSQARGPAIRPCVSIGDGLGLTAPIARGCAIPAPTTVADIMPTPSRGCGNSGGYYSNYQVTFFADETIAMDQMAMGHTRR